MSSLVLDFFCNTLCVSDLSTFYLQDRSTLCIITFHSVLLRCYGHSSVRFLLNVCPSFCSPCKWQTGIAESWNIHMLNVRTSNWFFSMAVPVDSFTSKVKEFSCFFTSFSTAGIFCIFVFAAVMANTLIKEPDGQKHPCPITLSDLGFGNVT